jgi:hypothetical protein
MATWTLAPFLRAIDERRWLRHGLFWLVQTALIVWLLRFGVRMVFTLDIATRDAFIVLTTHMLSVYLLLYGVLPRLWRNGGQDSRIGWWLAGWGIASFVLTFAFRFAIMVPLRAHEQNPFPDYHLVFSTGNYFTLLAVAGVAASLRMYRHWWQEELANLRLTRENFQAELQLLKAQVHPHFLFNTLNSLYSLTLKQSDQAPAVVERLTGLLQAVLQQGTAPLVPLADEVALLRNFIALERLRYGHRLMVDFRAGAMPATGYIAPLLLLPLVENAFKHGAAEQVGRATVRIALAVQGSAFSCLIVNSKNAGQALPTGPAGIGLHNVRLRLQLLYPQRHRLKVEARPDTFSVQLVLQLPDPASVTIAPPAGPLVAQPPAASFISPALPAHENAA